MEETKVEGVEEAPVVEDEVEGTEEVVEDPADATVCDSCQ